MANNKPDKVSKIFFIDLPLCNRRKFRLIRWLKRINSGARGHLRETKPVLLCHATRHSVMFCPDGGIGRHAGLKILWPGMAVPVRSRLRALDMALQPAAG